MTAHLAAIIGWPVTQSPSPAMHNVAFEALGLDWTYVSLAVRPGAVEEGVGLLRTLGVDGANVTVPHKQSVIAFLDGLEGDAEAFGAVNTIARDGDRLIGTNTDGEGFLRAIADEGFDPSGARALILGAGGAARAVALALARAGADVTVSARRAEQAAAIGCAVTPWGGTGGADIVVNATPAREGLPLRVVEGARLAVDLLYLPPETEFLAAARASGTKAIDGIGMLVHQAALSFERWTGRSAPVEVMRDAALAARGMNAG